MKKEQIIKDTTQLMIDGVITKNEADNILLNLHSVSKRCSNCLYRKYRPHAKHKYERNTCQITGLSISNEFNIIDCGHFKQIYNVL